MDLKVSATDCNMEVIAKIYFIHLITLASVFMLWLSS